MAVLKVIKYTYTVVGFVIFLMFNRPGIAQSPYTQRVLTGADVILPCDYNQASDGTIILITWSVDVAGTSQNLYVRQQGSSGNSVTPPSQYVGRVELDGVTNLRLSSVVIDDEQEYTCIVTASINSPTTIVNLLTFVQPQKPTITMTPSSVDQSDVPVGTNLTLTCSSTGGRPPADLTWTVSTDGGTATSLQPSSNTTTTDSQGVGDSTVTVDITISDNSEYTCTSTGPGPIVEDTASESFKVKKDATVTDLELPDSSGLTAGAIAGIVIGVLGGVALIGIGIALLVIKKPCGK